MTVLLESPEEDLLWRICQRIEGGQFDLPALPATIFTVMDLSARPGAEIADLVDLITRDPLLSSELLKTANSALFGTAQPAQTLQEAVMRIGLRSMRGVLLSVSMRGILLGSRGLTQYAEEVWRQAQSVASIARDIAKPLGFDPDRAYLLGLLHDVGKISLLAMLRREVGNGTVTPALVGRVFQTLHEKAGGAMAAAWKLPEEVAAVAACHHRFQENKKHSRPAALAQLAHHLDLYLSLRDDGCYRAMARSPMFEVLCAEESVRWKVLDIARATYRELHGEKPRAEDVPAALPKRNAFEPRPSA